MKRTRRKYSPWASRVPYKKRSRRRPDLAARQLTRDEILDLANTARSGYSTRTYSARHIQEAVCIVRRRGLVEPDRLVVAGFSAPPVRDPEAQRSTAEAFARKRDERIERKKGQ